MLTPGHAGMENPALGLAEAVGLPLVVKRVRPRWPWVWLPAGAWPFAFAALGADSDRLAPPWPDLLITCGRRAVPYALAIKRLSGGRTFTVHIQDPRVAPARFDVVTAPRHDRLEGENVVPTLGGLSRLTRAKLADAAATWAPQVAQLPRPRVAVLVGGSSRAYRLDAAAAGALGRQLAELARREGAGLLLTTSRRTGAEAERALRAGLADTPCVEPRGDDAYAAILGLADAVVVTCDSVNMITEAMLTGRPVLIARLPGGSRRFARFHDELYGAGRARPFAGRLERWDARPLEETQAVAAELRRRLAGRVLTLPAAPLEALS